MRITLAVPHEGHQPGDSPEVDDSVGRQLIADGHARPFDADEQPEDPGPAPEVGAWTASDLAASLVETFDPELAPEPESATETGLSAEQIEVADRDTLRVWCGDRGLGTGGNTQSLRARLTAALTESGPLANPTDATGAADPEEA